MPSPKVRMFCDWDNGPDALLRRLRAQTPDFVGNSYESLEFVTDDSYEFAVVFNYLPSDVELKCPPEKAIGLVLEPPEICEWMHPMDLRARSHQLVKRYFSFADVDGYEFAPCMGFATTEPWILSPLPSDKLDSIVAGNSTIPTAVMIASDKTFTPFHLKRREILQALISSEVRIDFYGRGMKLVPGDTRIKGPIAPMAKHQTIQKYPFCIDFENSPRKVLTDKFFDPILRGTVPITNASVLLEHGVEGSYEFIDFNDSVESIVKQIGEIISQRDLSCYDAPVLAARRELLQGRMCLAKWIEERVAECVS